MSTLSFIYSVFDPKKNITEVQLCLTQADLEELNKYCTQVDSRRVRGLIQEEIYIGHSFRRHLPTILGKHDIKAQVMYLDMEPLQNESNYTFYRNGLRISPIDTVLKRYDINFFEYKSEAHEELVICCDRNRFECFFQFIKAFSQGFWGDLFDFSETLRISTCIHDYTEESLLLFYDSNYN